MNELSLFDALFGDVMDSRVSEFNRPQTCGPKVDVTESKDCYNLEMELPGRTENDVTIEVDNNVLTIASVKEEVKEEKSENKQEETEKPKWLIRERRVNQFSRRFTLPEDVDTEKLSASFKNGVLYINMPRKALAAPKRIAINCA